MGGEEDGHCEIGERGEGLIQVVNVQIRAGWEIRTTDGTWIFVFSNAVLYCTWNVTWKDRRGIRNLRVESTSRDWDDTLNVS